MTRMERLKRREQERKQERNETIMAISIGIIFSCLFVLFIQARNLQVDIGRIKGIEKYYYINR